MLVSDGDSKAPSDTLRSNLRSRESSDSGFRVSALLENANYLQNMLTENVGMIKIASDLHFLYQDVEECMMEYIMEYKMTNLRSGDS